MSGRHWNLRRRKELGQAYARTTMDNLRGRPLAEVRRWCAGVRAQGMSDSTMEALLDACAWRGRLDPDNEKRAHYLSVRRHHQHSRYWRLQGLEPPQRDLRIDPRRCVLCTARMPWAAVTCRSCGLDQWNPHLRRWEPTSNKETA